MSPTYLAGYDGGGASEDAVRFAIRLAAPTNTEVIAANVLAEQLGREAWEDAQTQSEKLLAGLGEAVSPRFVSEGPAAHGLHDLAVEVDASLLFVGATHRGAFGRMVPGSVGERLIHAAPCPLVIVPEASDGPVATIGVAFDGRDASHSALRAACALAVEQQARVVLLTVVEAHPTLGGRLGHPTQHPAGRRATRVSAGELLATATELVPAGIAVEQRGLTGPAGPARRRVRRYRPPRRGIARLRPPAQRAGRERRTTPHRPCAVPGARRPAGTRPQAPP